MSNLDYTRSDFLKTSTMAVCGVAAGINGARTQQAASDIPDAEELVLKIGGADNG